MVSATMTAATFGLKARRRGGQAVVEFAMILPVFILLVLGAIEFGRAFYTMHLLINAAREGARRGILPDATVADVNQAVNSVLTRAGLSGTWTTAVNVTTIAGSPRTGGLANAVEGDAVEVVVTYNFRVLTGSLLPGFAGTVRLRGRCCFRHE